MALTTPNGIDVCLDSNIILEGRSLADLPWRDLSAEGPIRVWVTARVVEEIDGKKRDGRLGAHARAFNRLLTPAVTEGAAVVVREAAPRVELSFAAHGRIDWDAWPAADPDDGDTQVVLEALNATTPGPRLLVSHDIKPLALARAHGLAVHRASDDWLRPIEPGPKDKEIQRLKQQVQDLRRDEPTFEISISLSPDDPLSLWSVVPLDDTARGDLSGKLQGRVRPLSQRGDGVLGIRGLDYDHTYDDRFDAYHDTTLPAFAGDFHNRMGLLFNQRRLVVRVANIGLIRAEHLTVEIATSDGWLNDRLIFVSPNGPPAPKLRSPFGVTPGLWRGIGSQVGRHEFDPVQPAERSPAFAATCEDFRSRDRYEYRGVLVPTPTEGAVEITVTLRAGNLRGAVTETRRWDKTLQAVEVSELVDLETLIARLPFPLMDEMRAAYKSREDVDNFIEIDGAEDD